MKLINSPQQLKKLTTSELTAQAASMRTFLVSKLSKTGGHLASNLGVVELTLALHKVFDTPADKIIWDVGHQSYVHKIITGRGEDFDRLRQLDGLSGFPKSSESPHDAFDTGHSSTSISAALGFALARDLRGEKHHVIALLGDGSMTGGLAYEGLNNAGNINTNLLVILNDNEMSISKNVGAVSKHLNNLRTTSIYRGAKSEIQKLLDAMPAGKKLERWLESARDALKFALVPGVLFEELGFRYFGPIDGHDIKVLVNVLDKLKTIRGPVLLHVLTKKGKGFVNAEESPEEYHGIEAETCAKEPFPTPQNGITYTKIFGSTLLKLAKREPRLAAITAAMPEGTGLCPFMKKYPKRFFDTGIAEAHAVTFAAGLAKGGMLPVVAIYSSFLQRAYDQIIHDVCNQNLHVVFAIDRAGIVGADGETHQGIFDLSYLRHMPNMTILAPKDAPELEKMLNYAILQHRGPIAVRYPRGKAAVYNEGNASVGASPPTAPIIYPKAEIADTGESKKIAIVSAGTMFESAKYAAEKLSEFAPTLINARFIKPIDSELATLLTAYKHVFVLEDNVRGGGFGESLQTAVGAAACRNSPNFKIFAFPDKFIEQGTREELLRRYGLDGEGVLRAIRECLCG